MKIDLNVYAANREFIQRRYEESAERGLDEIYVVSLFAPSIHCPCICLAFFIAEKIGFTPKLVKNIESLIATYGYKEILNQREGSPFLHLDRKHDRL
jgi:hypothetical protein